MEPTRESNPRFSPRLSALVDRLRADGYLTNLTPDEECYWIDETRRGDPEAKLHALGHVVRAMLCTSYRYARRFNLDVDDCFQQSYLAFEHALKKFETGRGTRFLTYLTWWMRSYVERMGHEDRLIYVPWLRDVIRNQRVRDTVRTYKDHNGIYPSRSQLHALHPELPPAVLDYYEARLRALHVQSLHVQLPGSRRFFEIASSETSLDRWMERLEERARVRAALARMKDRRNALILERRAQGTIFDVLAKELSLTRERVRQLERKGLRELSALLGGPAGPRYSMADVLSWSGGADAPNAAV